MNYGQQYDPDWQEYGTYGQTSFPQYQLNTPQPPAAVSMAPQAASTAASPAMPNPWIQGAGLALGGAGTLLGAYGAYKQSQAMKEQADLANRNFEFQKALALQDRETSADERRRQSALQGGQYAMGVDDRLYDRYGEYSRRTGA